MRVLQVLSSLNIGSGIANVVVNYYRKIDKEKIQFDFLLFEKMPKSFESEVLSLGGKLYYIDKPTLCSVGKYKRIVKEFFETNRSRWSAVHIHEILVQRYVSAGARRAGIHRIVIHSHGTKFAIMQKDGLYIKNLLRYAVKRIRNFYLLGGIVKNSDVRLACSNDAGKALFKKADFTVLKNAIDYGKYKFNVPTRQKYRELLDLRESEKCIMHVGRLCDEKNQLFLIDAFSVAVAADSNMKLVLVGDGRMKSTLEKRVNEKGIGDKVVFIGNRSDIGEMLMAADLFVFPSINEGLGIALIEAQASGLACIASDSIPKEADCTGTVKFASLVDGVEKWADLILKTDVQRMDNGAAIASSGYDLNQSVKLLENIYTGVIE